MNTGADEAREEHEEHDSAGPAEHFLQRLDRLDRESTNIALVMYRSHDAVAAVLERLPASRGTQRVAFALSGDPEPPFVLVTHEGRFVTCLAAGMLPTGCFVVTLAQLDETLRKVRVDDQRARAWKERSARGPQNLVMRLVLSDGWIAREDISALLAVRASMERELVLSWVEMGVAAMQQAATLARIDKPVLRARVSDAELRRLWRSFVSVGHLGLMATAGHSKQLELLWQRAASEELAPWWNVALLGGDPYVCTQALNVVARGGRYLLPLFKRKMSEARSSSAVIEAASALVAIGARHESLAAEVRKVLASDGPPESSGRPWREKNRRWLDKLWSVSVDMLTERRAALAHDGIAVVSPNLIAASEASDEPQPTFGSEDLEPIIDQMSAVGLGFIEHNGTYYDTKTVISKMAGWAGRAAVEDFYPDERWAKLAPRPWSRERSWALADALGKSSGKTPVRVEEKPGRNDPCSCGSGKKYKKCCGG